MLEDGVKKIGSKKLEDGVKKMLDQRWRRKFPLLSPRRSHNWRRSIKENDPRAAATKMSSHNVQTPDTCLMSDVYHHSPSHCQVDNNLSQEHFETKGIPKYGQRVERFKYFPISERISRPSTDFQYFDTQTRHGDVWHCGLERKISRFLMKIGKSPNF